MFGARKVSWIVNEQRISEGLCRPLKSQFHKRRLVVVESFLVPNTDMKVLSLCAIFVLTCAASAAPEKKVVPVPEKKGAPDLAFARTWVANAAALTGKSVATCIQEIGDIGQASSAAPCVVVPVVTGNERGESGGPILALVPITSAQSFVENAASAGSGKITKFGTKVVPTVTNGTFAIVEGEPVLVIGAAVPVLGGKKPSAMLATQLGQ